MASTPWIDYTECHIFLTKVGEIPNPFLYPTVCSEHGDVLCAAKLAVLVHVFICNVFARPETERTSRADAGCWIGRGCVGGLRICQLAEERARQETRRIASTADNLSWTGRGKEARAAREPGEIPWSGSCHLWRWSRVDTRWRQIFPSRIGKGSACRPSVGGRGNGGVPAASGRQLNALRTTRPTRIITLGDPAGERRDNVSGIGPGANKNRLWHEHGRRAPLPNLDDGGGWDLGDLRARQIPGPLLLRRVAERTLGRSGAAAGNPAGVAPSTFVLVHCMVGILRCAAVLPLVSCSTHGMTPSRTNSYVLRSICACQSGIRACVLHRNHRSFFSWFWFGYQARRCCTVLAEPPLFLDGRLAKPRTQ